MTVNDTFDVIVVGGGNAGLVAALAAHEAGAKVVVLEAAPKAERGGNSRFAGSIFRIPHGGKEDIEPLLHPSVREEIKSVRFGPYTKEKYHEDMMRTTKGRCDQAQTKVMLDKAYDTVKWMAGKGCKWQLTLGKFFAKDVAKGGIDDMVAGGVLMSIREGDGLMDDLFDAVEKTSITVLYGSPATELITRGDTILGVKTRQRNSEINYMGQVILASGGFEANPRMRRQYLGEGWDLVLVRGTRFNMGAMTEKAIAAGAGSVGHWAGCHATPQDQNAPAVGDLSVSDRMSRYSYPWGISVNILGKRFFDEGENNFGMTYAKTGGVISKQPEAKAYQIFDQKTLHLLEPRYTTGVPIVADTVRELGERIGVDVNAFCKTVEEFNAACPEGEFSAFKLDGLSTGDRLEVKKSNWAQRIDQGPFVCYPVTVGITFTYGGIRVNEKSEVLNNEGLTMPGLWGIGEFSGGLFAFNYPGGSGLVKGAVFGRISGYAAAKRAAEQNEKKAKKL